MHRVGPHRYTVVYLDPSIAPELPFAAHPRLRVEADVSGVTFKGAWQPARGRWFLMLPKAQLREAGLAVGRAVEVAFRVIDQDDVDVPDELSDALRRSARARKAWEGLSAGKRRGLSHMVASAKRAETRVARATQVVEVLLGERPLPWARRDAAARARHRPPTSR